MVNVEEVFRHLIRVVGPSLLSAVALKDAQRVIPASIEHTLDELGLGTALAAPDINYMFGSKGVCAEIEKHHLRSE